MLLAQITEGAKVAEQVLNQSSQYGPMGFALAVFFLFFVVLTGWLCHKVILPLAKATADSLKMNSETLAAIGAEHAVIKSHLSDIRDAVLKTDSWPSDEQRRAGTPPKAIPQGA